MGESEWYRNWFDSPYYHILYKNRDYKEAELFIDNLLRFIDPKQGSKILDIACGRGRHSLYLSKKGFDVTGIDLSPASIEYAKTYENSSLRFFVHDMRKVFRQNYFELAVNLFTSFGYFESEEDNLSALKSASESLKKEGLFVIDFMNSEKVMNELVKEEIKKENNIEFKIFRRVEENFVKKKIVFIDKGKSYSFEEKVKALNLKDFERYFKASNLKLVNLFGDYNLKEFVETDSERLIMICKKQL